MKHFEGDLRDDHAIGKVMEEVKPQIVFHLAAQALVREALRQSQGDLRHEHGGGAVNLLEAIRHSSSVRTLVFITSDKCYRNCRLGIGVIAKLMRLAAAIPTVPPRAALRSSTMPTGRRS